MGCAADNEIRIPGGRSAAGAARAALNAELDGHISERELRDLCLLLSEVVNNSVIHGQVDEDGWIGIEIALEPDSVRVAVRDSGEQGDPVARKPDYERGGGFGLFLVEAMSSRWGVDREIGLTVWFELDRVG